MSEYDNTPVTATLTLSRDDWRTIICGVMNDASMMEMGLCAQIGKAAVNRITDTALRIVASIEEATGVTEDKASWKFIYRDVDGRLASEKPQESDCPTMP